MKDIVLMAYRTAQFSDGGECCASGSGIKALVNPQIGL